MAVYLVSCVFSPPSLTLIRIHDTQLTAILHAVTAQTDPTDVAFALQDSPISLDPTL